MLSWVETRAAAVVRARGLARNRVGVETDEESAARILAVARRQLGAHAPRLPMPLCTFVTDGPDGPTARIVMPFPPTPDLAVHLATSPTSTKARQVVATGKAVLVYARGSVGVTAYCHAETVDDPDERRRWWRPVMLAYWPQGLTEDYAVIRCRPYAFEVFAPDAGVGPAPHGLRSGRIVLDQDRWLLDMPDDPR